jgi:chromosome segregation ATPase
MRLNRLSLKNFKGAREVVLDAAGRNVTVTGPNGTGKTTFADAWFWLLFNKDSLGRAEFGIKTLDENLDVIHHLEHGVEAEIETADGRYTLKRVFSEEWTQSRGTNVDRFTGHKSEYFFNGVPLSETEYKRRVGAFCPEQRFRILTDFSSFAATFPTQTSSSPIRT